MAAEVLKDGLEWWLTKLGGNKEYNDLSVKTWSPSSTFQKIETLLLMQAAKEGVAQSGEVDEGIV